MQTYTNGLVHRRKVKYCLLYFIPHSLTDLLLFLLGAHSEVQSAFTTIAELSVGRTVRQHYDAKLAVESVWGSLPVKFRQQFSQYDGMCLYQYNTSAMSGFTTTKYMYLKLSNICVVLGLRSHIEACTSLVSIR